MNRQAQGVVLLLLGGAVLKASVTDLYLRYVKEGLQPFLIAAGAVLVVAAVVTLVNDLRGTPDAHDHGTGGHSTGGHGDGHAGRHGDTPAVAHHEPRVGWLLILPVLGLLLVAPPALGSFAAGQAGTALASQNQEVSDWAPLPPGDPAKITVLDYASRAVFDNGVSLRDRTVRITGFVVDDPSGEPLLARMILSCCAADGRPIKVGMTGNAPTGLPADQWIDVTGRYSTKVGIDEVNGERIPYIDVESWTEIPPPKNQYE